MKKLALLLFLFLGVFSAKAQFNLQSAIDAIEDKDFKEGKEYMDKTMEKKENKEKPKVWYYNAKLYHGIATSEDEEVKKLAGEKHPVIEAYDSYLKALGVDTMTQESMTKMMKNVRSSDASPIERQSFAGLMSLWTPAFNSGSKMFNESEFETSANLFQIAFLTGSLNGKQDTAAIDNAAISLTNAGKTDEALRIYKRMGQMGYREAQPFISRAVIHQRKGDMDKMVKALKEGRDKYPSNVKLINTLSQYYLRTKNYEEARKSLSASIETDSTNPVLYFNLGRVYDQLYQKMRRADTVEMEMVNEYFDKSVDNYKQAIEYDEQFTDAHYNLGALYYNEGAELNNKANESEDDEEYKRLKEKANENFEKAIAPLEKAHEQDPDDISTMSSLTQAYAQTDNMEKYEAMKKKLEEAQK